MPCIDRNQANRDHEAKRRDDAQTSYRLSDTTMARIMLDRRDRPTNHTIMSKLLGELLDIVLGILIG